MCKDCGCHSTGENARTLLSVPGMMCENCQNTVESALLKLPGVNAAEVDLQEKTVKVDFNGTVITEDQLIEAISATGFDASTVGHTHEHDGIMSKITKLFK